MSAPEATARRAKIRVPSRADRQLTGEATPTVKKELEALLAATAPADYAKAMERLGASLGAAVAKRLGAVRRPFGLVCTPEDADYLVEGMLQRLPRDQARLVCYWTERSAHRSGDVATVIQSYVDPRLEARVDSVVVAKAIISSGCIVRASLERLLTKVSPSRILIASPVMVAGAEKLVRAQFAPEVSSKFEFVTFACDAAPVRGQSVRPGVGGQVEERLGLRKQSKRHSPRLVQGWTQAA